MDNFPKVLCGWSWEENKLFELALAVVDEQHPDRWEVVAAMVGGEKTAEDVQKHYVILLEDLQFIESGKLDHKLGEAQSCIEVDCTDEDNKGKRALVHFGNGSYLLRYDIVRTFAVFNHGPFPGLFENKVFYKMLTKLGP